MIEEIQTIAGVPIRKMQIVVEVIKLRADR